MPPRRPGGKYKDNIKRAKGEATLAAEANANSVKLQQEYVKQVLAKRQEALLGNAVKTTKEHEQEQRRQRIMYMMMGGGKKDIKKFFRAWILGAEQVRDEKRRKGREEAWRRSCNCLEDDDAGACRCSRLTDSVFLLPFQATRGRGDRAGMVLRSGSLPQLSSPSGGVRHAIMSQRQGPPSRHARRTTELQQASLNSDSRHTAVHGDDEEKPFSLELDGEIQPAIHWSSGRRCFIDSNMRMSYSPRHAVSQDRLSLYV